MPGKFRFLNTCSLTVTGRSSRSIGLAALLLGALIGAACSSRQMRQAGALMETPIVPASDALFNAVIYTNGQLVASPQSEADWQRLAQHARSLIEAAPTLAALAPSDNPAEWLKQSDTLRQSAAAALNATERRSLDDLLAAGSRLYESCTGCHTVYVNEN